MPGELANVIAGRVANLFNLRGMNYTTDAACASGLAALNSAVTGLVDHQFDAVVTGGIDRNMGVDAFVKFCKIGALSATGTRPFDAGADGFVMGEGAALFVLKRLEDAERDGDRVYAVILGVGGSSDGKGKGITAPNPVGQQLAVERAWERAGRRPRHRRCRRGPRHLHPRRRRLRAGQPHRRLRRRRGRPALDRPRLGEVEHRSPQGRRRLRRAVQDGALAAREAARTEPALREPQPQRRLGHPAVRRQHRPAPVGGARERRAPRRRERLRVRRHELPRRRRGARPRPAPPTGPQLRLRRRAAASAPRRPLHPRLPAGRRRRRPRCAARSSSAAATTPTSPRRCRPPSPRPAPASRPRAPHRTRRSPPRPSGSPSTTPTPPTSRRSSTKLANAFASGNPAAFRLLRQQGIFVGRGPAPKVAFLYTGQGSQYVNMLKSLAAAGADRAVDLRRGRPGHDARSSGDP